MQIWITLILTLQIVSALVMIGLVLIQHGKGADMGASFGSGASGSLFGATGSANFLSRSTAACATVFFVCTLALAYASNSPAARGNAGGSVLDRAAPGAGAASAPATGVIPGAIPGGVPTVPAAPAAPGSAPAMGVPPPAAAPASQGAPAIPKG